MPHREVLRDAAAEVVANDGRVRDAEHIQQREHALGVPLYAEIAPFRPIAASVAEQIDDDDAVSRGNKRHDIAPDV
jgi:hypothetical protein